MKKDKNTRRAIYIGPSTEDGMNYGMTGYFKAAWCRNYFHPDDKHLPPLSMSLEINESELIYFPQM